MQLSKVIKPKIDWLPVELERHYMATDLTYDYCLMIFVQLEAAKREKFPPETARQWFIEFIKAGWTKEIVKMKTKLLMKVKVYGIEKLEIADWINAEEELNYSDPYKPPPGITDEDRAKTAGVMRKLIDAIDAGKFKVGKVERNTKRPTGLPVTYKADCVAKWRYAERIKKHNRD